MTYCTSTCGHATNRYLLYRDVIKQYTASEFLGLLYLNDTIKYELYVPHILLNAMPTSVLYSVSLEYSSSPSQLQHTKQWIPER